MIRDRLVCGVNNDLIQRRLLSETELGLKKALELALGMETAAKNVRELQGTRRAAEPQLHKDVCKVQREVMNNCPVPFQDRQVSQLWQSRPYKESLQTTKETTHFSRETDTKAPCQDSARGN